VQTLICGCTDSFVAQARINRLALQFGLPTLASQVYERGFGAELAWLHPAISHACLRCILNGRYRAYEEGFENTSSDGAPVTATLRLNAAETFLALALLHHGRNHAIWGNLIARLGNRQLVQIRCHPDAEAALGLRNFSQAFADTQSGHLFADESIWRPQLPECPETGYAPCADCGGGGDLQACVGTFTDTRIMRISP
jgi:hypothetical protein